MSKPTQAQIAARAGVGTATVERVLNGRGGVAPATAARVVAAARALDWPGRLPERHRGVIRIEVIFVRPETSFYQRLAAAFRRIARTLDPAVQVQVTFMDETDSAGIAARIRAPSLPRAGLVITTPDLPDIRAAVEEVRAAGLPLVVVTTRLDAQAPFVGIDNHAAGRMAALMMTRMCRRQGSVITLSHSWTYAVHRARILGFSDYLAEHPAPGLRHVFTAFGQDDRRITARRVAEALARWPDLVGIYNSGGANAGVLEALAAAGRKVFYVGHELTEATAEGLRSGAADVIFDQVPEAQARRAIDLLLWRIGLTGAPVANPPIRFTTLTRENL